MILWHKRIAPSLKEWRLWYLTLTGDFLQQLILQVYAAPFQWRTAYFHQKNLWRKVLETNKTQVPLKSYSLKIRIDSVNQILKNKEKVTSIHNINILTRIKDWKIPCVYTHIYHIIKIEDLVRIILCAALIIENIFSNAKSKGSTCFTCWRKFSLVRVVGKTWRCSCWKKGNSIMINEFNYGQTWKIWPSPLTLSLYSTFKSYCYLTSRIWSINEA